VSLFDLAKAAGHLLMPAGLLWLTLLASAGLLLRRRQWAAGALVVLSAILFAAAGNFYAGSAMMAGLERRIPPLELERAQPFDAVFVLGGGTDLDPWGRPILGEAGDRVAAAARLWHAGKARLLVASGSGLDAVTGPRDLGAETRTIWLGMGVPRDAILVVERPCLNTRQEIQAYRELQDRRHFKRMALVSSASHLPRALALAEKAGLAFTPVGADWRGRSHAFQVQRLVPAGDGFLLTQRACWEHLGRFLGK
jgi:uncharacterized SAM-binding protein YcdF (DUF218 family)